MQAHNFIKAEKKITSPELMVKWGLTKTYTAIMEFIKALQSSIKGKQKSDIKKSENPCIIGFNLFFKELERILKDTPPFESNQRFGNKAFRDWYSKLEKEYSTLLTSTILKSKPNEGLVTELKSYILDCFGSAMRIDYGTGHELNFLCILLILCEAQYFTVDDFPNIVLEVFFEYILFVRKIQTTYKLEPAGAHGVWGLDEYHFLPFLFGASQLVGNYDLTPKVVHDDSLIRQYQDEYMYLSAVSYVKNTKRGARFGEYAPMLDTISNVPNWEKVSKGLVKMYEDEVMKKFVVVQHFYFGSVLKFE